MERKLTTKSVLIRKNAIHEPQSICDLKELHTVLQELLAPDLKRDLFDALFGSSFYLLDLTYQVDKTTGKVAATYCAIFYKTGEGRFIARAITVLAPAFRGKKCFEHMRLYRKYIRFVARHPLSVLTINIYAVSPFIFYNICKNVRDFHPRPTPEELEFVQHHSVPELMELGRKRLSQEPTPPWLVDAPFQVAYDTALECRIAESTNNYIKWYCYMNPFFLEKKAIQVIVDVTRSNSVFALFKWMMGKITSR